MQSDVYHVEKKTLFSESLIWQFNRDFYHQNGIAAWRNDIIPHKITNSSLAATTYAELIYAFLKDLDTLDNDNEVVYILEMGAGHGRLCFNVLEHLDQLIASDYEFETKYCYILSDIVEENLSFFSSHPKLQKYYDRGVLDLSYFDGTGSTELVLRKSQNTIAHADLKHPILAIANYFFDSLPNELFYFQDGNIFNCSVSIDSAIDPKGQSAQDLISQMDLTYYTTATTDPIFENPIYNRILAQYNQLGSDTYILFPKMAMECLTNVSALSKAGLVVMTMDKGYKELNELMTRVQPDVVKHGSFSMWVNFHAISQFCTMSGGSSMFDSSTNLSIELGCLLFMKEPHALHLFDKTYRKYSRQLNVDDVNSMKKLVYKNLATTNLSELLGLIRLNAYDSSIFIDLLPRIKKLSKRISVKQRSRLRQTIIQVWNKYYAIKDDYDFSYELGGLMYDLGYYNEALGYFKSSSDTFGYKVDVDYNQILCYYQLRQDGMFYQTLKEAKLRFPQHEAWLKLEQLDMK